MDVETVLDTLGNESRRRILELLSKKPCYVSEISYFLKMAPKVVLDHLEKLEKAGLVSNFEEGRRRYYFINRSLRLEVLITPHKFSANLNESRNEDINWLFGDIKEVFESIEKAGASSISEVYSAIRRAEDLERQFARIQNVLVAKFNDFVERILSEIEEKLNDDLERLVMLALAKGMTRAIDIAESFRLPYREVERVLYSLMDRGLVKKVNRGGEYIWIIC